MDKDAKAFQDLIDQLDDTTDAEMYLEYADDGLPYSEAELAAEDALSEYDLAEILEMNEIDDSEVLALLFRSGDVGLPMTVDDDPDDEDESVQGSEEEEV